MPGASPEERALHDRLLEGDPAASAELFDWFLTPLIEELSRFRQDRALHERDTSLIWDAVTDALFKYVEAPQKYNPEAATLRYYLRMSAEGDLKNRIAQRARKEAPKESLDVHVELGREPRNSQVDDVPEGVQHLIDEDLWQRIETIIPDPQDQAVVRLLLDGERDTEAFAQILNLKALSIEAQRQEVKRVKDRLKAKLKRAGWEGYLDR